MLVTDKVLDMLESISAAKGTNAKKELLKTYLNHYPFQRLIKYTFDPYRSFNVVKVPKVKKGNRVAIEPQLAWENFLNYADTCSKREVTGNAAINLIHSAFQSSSELQEKWMRKVLKKNLAIGISTKTINKVMPGLIPTFDVALAQKFEHKRMSQWVYVEPKLDGIRCLAVVDGDDVKLFTRAGKLITNFDDTVGKELARLPSGAYDGEIMSNDFTDLMRQVYRKENKDVSDVYFAIFDYLTPEEWREKGTTNSLKTRKTLLKSFIDSAHKSENLKYLKQVRYEPYLDPTEAQLKSEHDRWVARGYEGIMIKDTDACYSFGRIGLL